LDKEQVKQQKKDNSKACKAAQVIRANLIEEGKPQRQAAALQKQLVESAKTAVRIRH
jgi:hypothetical protein